MSVRQALTHFYYSLNPLFVGGDGQHAKPLPAEPGAVKVLRPSRFVGEQFSLETGLVKIAACHGHGVTVGFKEIPTLFAVEFQTKYPVGNDPAFLPLADVHLPLKRFAPVRDLQIVRRQQPDVFPVPARQFKSNHNIGNQQGVLKEQSADVAFLLPIKLMELQRQLAFQPGCAFVAQTVGDPS